MNELSQAFASAFFFRLVLPGLTLAIGVHPLLSRLPLFGSTSSIYPGGTGALFLVEVTALGLIAYASATPIYHCAQGLILPWLTRPARAFNQWRFDRTYKAFAALYGERSYDQLDAVSAKRLQEHFVYLSDYPIARDSDGIARWAIRHATRVGNITATYEDYPDSRYGLNAEGFWFHVLFLVPHEIRKELDAVQATAVGTLLAAAAGWGVVVLSLLIGLARTFGTYFPGKTVASLVVSDVTLLGLAVYGLAAAVLFNYLSRDMHREYGRMYRACFDVNFEKVRSWLDLHHAPLSTTQVQKAERFRVYASALSSSIDAPQA